MALPAIIDIPDLEGHLGVTFDASQHPMAQSYLQVASTVVRAYTNETYVDAEGELEADIDDKVVAAVKLVAARAWKNPRGAIRDTTGPFTVDLGEAAAQGFYLTQTDRDLLSKQGNVGLWTLRTTRGDYDLADVYIDVAGSDKPIPADTPL